MPTVYRGRLSKACAECRAKATRVHYTPHPSVSASDSVAELTCLQCDTARPSCGQCRRTGRVCTGYQDLETLRVLDQTKDVTRKGYAKAKHALVGRTEDPVVVMLPSDSLAVSAPKVFPQPKYLLRNAATSAFFAEYVSICQGPVKTDFDFVLSVYDKSKPHGMLSNAVAALGTLVVAKRNSDPTIWTAAAVEHACTLKQIRSSLEDAVVAIRDETLATVSLLALHEGLSVGFPYHSPWIAVHLEGAARLLHLRGHSQLRTGSGRRLFLRLTSMVISSSLHCRKALPSVLSQMLSFAQQFCRPDERVAVQLFELGGRLCELLEQHVPPRVEDEALLLEFAELAKLLEAWTDRLTPSYAVETVSSTWPNRFSYRGQHDEYSNHVAAAVWCKYRCMLILAYEETRRLAKHMQSLEVHHVGHHDLRYLRVHATARIKASSEDICRSVQYVVSGSDTMLSKSERERDRTVSMYAATAVLQPLQIAARASPEIRQWISERVMWIRAETSV
ncbi:hypothetical protein BAUCODRAFT_20551 [Baudoinia panamericana UAMH 10762]|uniref:Zn(2)-C6 fungal-type domain-containing protein n=1 Tax=Baudoinia panamericana (strain UAMH 10762) TaxID=717646 RepID=M2NMN7_BAUPA|nr:uncharacterized protein BAUCODRAFT_20551 [Baudoinia panamericana UAMH 10762]EMD00451.1 hypothetical protein BAUCODRAFT_20551 [Baudoinia panamericana UAMH 10762]